MFARSFFPRQSRSERLLRGVLAAVALAAGGFSVALALAWSLASGAPLRAYDLAPYDGQIAGKAAFAIIAEPKASISMQQRADIIARNGLRLAPTAVSAAAALGLGAEIQGDKTAARRYFAYAQSLSRRDRVTQLWAIEDAVRRSDVAGTLAQYDITLRTLPKLAPILYPVLAQASVDTDVRSGLIKTLSKKPIWSADFINFVSSDSGVPVSTASVLMTALQVAHVAIPNKAVNAVITRLFDSGNIAGAWELYKVVNPSTSSVRSRDPRFARASDTVSPFDWVPVDSDGITAGIGSNAFNYSVAAGSGGVMLRQVELLPPGRYLLTGRTQDIDQPSEARPYWQLTCRGGNELGRLTLPNSRDSNGVFSARFAVPLGCPVQVLSLIAVPGDAIGGATGQINSTTLAPLGNSNTAGSATGPGFYVRH